MNINYVNLDTSSNIGDKILPSTYNIYARKNAERFYTIDKSKPKEPFTQTVYWTRTEWAGRGETREVTEFTDINRYRNHRDYHLPYSVEFTMIERNNVKIIISDSIIFTNKNFDKIKNTINMLLSLFGECSIISDEDDLSMPVIKRLQWELLPSGNHPWTSIENNILKLSEGRKNTNKEMMIRNCEIINSHNPDFIAYGKAGFKGYAVFGFTHKNLYILESVIPNNATYVFDTNWENLSKLTKAEILDNNYQKCRIIHNSSWNQHFSRLIQTRL